MSKFTGKCEVVMGAVFEENRVRVYDLSKLDEEGNPEELPERAELSDLLPKGSPVQIIAPEERRHFNKEVIQNMPPDANAFAIIGGPAQSDTYRRKTFNS